MSTSIRSLSRLFCMAAMLCLFSTACQKNNAGQSAGSKQVNLFLTDDPSVVYDNIFVDIRKVEIKAEDAAEAEKEHNRGSESGTDDDNGSLSGGWITLNSTPGVYDILRFRNGLDTLFSTGSFLSSRTPEKIRLTLGNNNKVVFNGVAYPLTLKKSFVVINLEESLVTLSNTGNLNIWLDFDGGRSIRSNGNSFELEPGMKAFSKDKTGSLEGRVTPAEARAVVMAINGTDTATAKPEREGEFRIMGLKAGTYQLRVHATAGNYADATLSGIVVRTNEDTKTGTITLHR